MRDNIIKYVVGDTLPNLTGTLTDAAGDPLDISSYAITLHIGTPTPVVIDATVTDGASGVFAFAIDGSELVAGRWPAEVQVVSPSGTLTYQESETGRRFTLMVAEEIA